MRISQRSKAFIGLLVGAAALLALVAAQSIETVVGLLAEAGYGLLLVCLFAPPEQMLAAESWRRLLPRDEPPSRWLTLYTSWMGSAVNALLPVATISGETVKTRALILWGQPAAETIAATAVDKTVQATATLVCGLIGGGFLAATVGEAPTLNGGLIGAGFLLLVIAGFVAVQLRGGLSLIAATMAERTGVATDQALATCAAAVEATMRVLYRDVGRLTRAVMLGVGQRLFPAAEVVLIGWLMGQPVGIVDAVILTGLVGALRGLSFGVPAGLGVQEAGYAAVGALLGYPPDLMIAVSLATRVREILPNLPLLLAWQTMEGRAPAALRRGT